MSLYNLLKTKKNEILKIAKKHGAYNIRIFGSVLRQTDNENSDIDLLVDFGKNISSWFPAGLIIDLENLLRVKVDIATEKSLKQRIKDKVIKEAVPL